MTEDELVAGLRAIVEDPSLARPAPRRIIRGIGDDAAVWQPSRSHLAVITTDALVDGVHYLQQESSARSIGHRAMAANLSDIAAMGARPVLATVILSVGPDATEPWILDCYRGMAAVAARFGACIVGGDIVRSTVTSLGISVVGEVSRSRLKRRDTARPGDVLAVTGPLGGSRAGLEVIRRHLPADDLSRAARAAFETPEPRVREGRWFASSRYVRAMMDCSDGLSTDASRLAAASGCGATIECVPIAPAAAAVASRVGDNAEAYALDGGEDFELLVAVAPRAFDYLARRFAVDFGRPLHRVGRVDREPGLRRAISDAIRPLVASGFDHLAECSPPGSG